jgi:hypothetical protein
LLTHIAATASVSLFGRFDEAFELIAVADSASGLIDSLGL